MKKSTATLVLSIVMCGAIALGASGGHSEEGVPLDKIGWQAANLGILLVGIFFIIKKSMIETFKNRQKDFLDRSEKTKEALKEAERSLAGIKEKLSKLEAGEANAIETARKEAEAMKAQIITDATVVAEKIKKDAELTIGNELSKAKEAINQAILNQALQEASKAIAQNKGLGSTQEASFIKQVEQVKA